MSLMWPVFLLVPIFMPGVGQIILLHRPWQLIFVAMGLGAAASHMAVIRLPESLSHGKPPRHYRF